MKELTNESLIAGAAWSHVAPWKTIQATGLEGEYPWQVLELLLTLRYSPGVTLTGSLKTSRAYRDTVLELRRRWPDLKITGPTGEGDPEWILRTTPWDQRVVQALPGEVWDNENIRADKVVLELSGRRYLNRKGEAVTEPAPSLTAAGLAKVKSLDLTGTDGVTLWWRTDGSEDVQEYLLDWMSGLQEIILARTTGVEVLDVSPTTALETADLSETTTGFRATRSNESLREVVLGNPGSLVIDKVPGLTSGNIKVASSADLTELSLTGLSDGKTYRKAAEILVGGNMRVYDIHGDTSRDGETIELARFHRAQVERVDTTGTSASVVIKNTPSLRKVHLGSPKELVIINAPGLWT